MSQFGNQGQVPGNQPYQNPYGSPNPPPPGGGSRTVYTRRKKKKTASPGAIIGIVLGVVGVSMLCCVGSCCGLWYWDLSNTENEIANLIRNSPELREEIGELQSLKTMMGESQKIDDMETYVYKATGSTGSTIVVISWDVDGNNNIVVNRARIRDTRGIERPITIR